jgi:hypothetical protein
MTLSIVAFGLIVWVATMAAIVFLWMAHARSGRDVSKLIWKPAYFLANPLLHPASLTTEGRKYRLRALMCFAIWGLGSLGFWFIGLPSLTSHPS